MTQSENAVIKPASFLVLRYQFPLEPSPPIRQGVAISIKAWMYCKLVRERNRCRRLAGGSVMVWESHQFQWALKTELLVACPPPCFPSPLLLPFRNRSLALLSIREPIASPPGNDGCEPSRTRIPPPNKPYPLFALCTTLFSSRNIPNSHLSSYWVSPKRANPLNSSSFFIVLAT